MENSTINVTIEKQRKEEEEEVEKSALDAIIDLMPFEMHVPGYKFCGPGTKLSERLARGEVGINPLDEACREHDIAYADKKASRRQADRVLAEKAFSRMIAGETPPDERTFAMMTACCMVSKITFEKFFKRIKKAIKKKDKKKPKKSVKVSGGGGVGGCDSSNKKKKKKNA